MTDGHSLDGVALLDSLTPAEREEVQRQCRWRRYPAHEQIIDSQAESRDVFFVVVGVVRIVNYSLLGREVALDDIGAGGYFGELAALDAGPRSASAMAKEETVTAALPPEQFLRLLRDHPPVALSVMQRLARVIRQATGRIMDLSTLGANNRVHAELLRMARVQTQDGVTATIAPIPLHADIASRVSTTRETVARVLNDLARNGVLKRERDSLQILDIPHLEYLVQEVRGD